MSHPTYEEWQLHQLKRLAESEPGRIQAVFKQLWETFPDLFEDVVVSAVEQEVLTPAEAAAKLDVSATTIDLMVIDLRQKNLALGRAITRSENQPARLAQSQITVWEVVREYRKHLSTQKLKDSFPSLNLSEIQAAIHYGEGNREEVDKQIERYETLAGRKNRLADVN